VAGPCEGAGAPWPDQLLWRRWMEEPKWRCRSLVQGEGNPSGGVGALGMDLRAGRPGPGCRGEVRRIRGWEGERQHHIGIDLGESF
jgi:hypothetical protein